jgi:hypothetical protein
MKISKETITVLRNFSSINASIIIPEGNTIITEPPARNVRATYVCPEEFPRKVAIYDLPEFLNGLSIFSQPELDFSHDRYVCIREGDLNVSKIKKVNYYYSDLSLIKAPPERTLELPDETIIADFVLDTSDVKTIFKSSNIYKLPDLTITTDDSGDIVVIIRDKVDSSKPSLSISVGTNPNPDSSFELNFKLETLKILEDSYRIRVANQKMIISEFISTTQDLSYIILPEFDSFYREI